MQQAVSARAPAHLWIVGILSLLWNCFGAYDYTMTKTRGAQYIESTMPGVDGNAALAWINGMPMYAQIGWAMGAIVTAIGVYLSYAFDLPTGATIVTTLGAALVVLAGLRGLVGRRSPVA